MSNFLGKVLLQGKKALDSINEVTGDAAGILKEQAVNASKYAKTILAISMLKAEIEGLYKELGEIVFLEGLMPDNDEAMEIMTSLFKKTAVLEHLESEINIAERDEDDIWDDFPNFEDFFNSFGSSPFGSNAGCCNCEGCSCCDGDEDDCEDDCEDCSCDCDCEDGDTEETEKL